MTKSYRGQAKGGQDISPDPDGLVRVNIRLTPEMHKKFARLIPWGIRRNVVEAVLALILNAIEKDGIVVAGAIIDGAFKLEPIYGSARRASATPTGGRGPFSDPEYQSREDDVQTGSDQSSPKDKP